MLLSAWAAAGAANLQTQDLLFFSTHKRPSQVAGDSRYAYLLTEGGVLVYDYRRDAWSDNLISPDGPITRIFCSADRGVLRVVAGGRVEEYNPAFRHFVPAESLSYGREAPSGRQANLNGLTLGGDFFFMGDAIRDKYLRRYPVTAALAFDYDYLWILTDGLGPFLGSARRLRAEPRWFALDQPAVQSIYADGGRIWFGGFQAAGALVGAKADLSEWKLVPAGLAQGFPNGGVRALRAWRGYLWLATDQGVVRMDPGGGWPRNYGFPQGGTGVRAACLEIHQGSLWVGTENGAYRLAQPDAEFESMPFPGGFSIAVNDLDSRGADLWAATRGGLFLLRDGQWALPDYIPANLGANFTAVRHRDSTMVWAGADKVMFRQGSAPAHWLMDRDGAFALKVAGEQLFVAWNGGVSIRNFATGQWTDIRLEDGVPGTKVTAMEVADGKLWVGTDAGVARIALRPYLP